MGELQVLNRTQKIIVEQGQSIKVVNGGPVVTNSKITIVDAGPIGPPGPQGSPGIVDPTDHSATGLVETPLLVWVINHDLEFLPAGVKFQTLDGEDELEPEELIYINNNRIVASWPEPTIGRWIVS